MADQMKKFLQDHRSELDHSELPVDLFDKVMTGSVQKKTNLSSSRNRQLQFVWRIAASVMLLIVAIKLLTITDKHNEQFAKTNQQIEIAPKNHEPSLPEVAKNTPNEIIALDQTIQKPLHADKKHRHTTKNIVSRSAFRSFEETITSSEIRNTQITDAESADVHKQFVPNEENLTNQQVYSTAAVLKSDVESPVVASTNAPVVTEVFKNTENQYLGQKVKKGIFAFLSKKSRKWTNNTLSIDPVETNQKTYLALNFNNKNLSFNRSLKIYNNQ